MAGTRSKISTLPKDIREQVDRLIREGAMIDEIVAHLRALDVKVSRSAVGRFKKRAEDQMRGYRERQDLAALWIQKIGEEPEGDVGRLVGEVLKMVASTTAMAMNESDEGGDPKDIHFLARALKDLESAGKISVERAALIRREVAAAAADRAVKAADEQVRKIGHVLPPEALKAIREQVYGVVDG